MENRRVLAIVGSRNMSDTVFFERCLKEACDTWFGGDLPDAVVSGGARGADSLGVWWARQNGLSEAQIQEFKPNWRPVVNGVATYDRTAGLRRNRDIIDAATHVVAFPSHQGKGTQHSMRLAQEQNKPLLVYYMD